MFCCQDQDIAGRLSSPNRRRHRRTMARWAVVMRSASSAGKAREARTGIEISASPRSISAERFMTPSWQTDKAVVQSLCDIVEPCPMATPRPLNPLVWRKP